MTTVKYIYTGDDLWHTIDFEEAEDAYEWCEEAEQNTKIEAYECVENGFVYNQWGR